MKTLFLIPALLLCVAAHAQQYKNPYEMLKAEGAYDKVLVMGEAEAREAVLHPTTKDSAQLRFMAFISKVSASYSQAPGLSEAESGMLIRTLYAMGPEPPTKFAVHFKLDGWFRANVDPKRYEVWKAQPVYPEYLYSYLLAEDAQSSK